MKTKYLNLLTLLCIVICLALSVGVAYARYQLEFPRRSYVFAPEVPDNIFMCGSVSQDWVNHGNLPDLADQWLPNGTGVKLDFAVTNGNSRQVSQGEQAYVIRLAAGLTVKDPEHLTVVLYWWDENGQLKSKNAVPTPIQEGGMLQASFGDGWEYRFYEEDQYTELSFSLTGGQLSYANYSIAVFGEVEETLLDVQVLGQNAYQ